MSETQMNEEQVIETPEYNFPLYIATRDATYTVRGMIGDEDIEYVEGKGYIADDGYAYIYKTSRPKKSMRVPIFYFDENENPVLVRSGNFSDIGYKFKAENLVDLSPIKIIETANPDEILFDPEVISDMIDAVSIYKPIINDDDDGLKKLVKAIIRSKDIDLNRLKSKMDKKYMLSNLRQALTSKTKMSITNFNIWAEVLGVDYIIIARDNNTDPFNPLPNPIVYVSKRDAIIEKTDDKRGQEND